VDHVTYDNIKMPTFAFEAKYGEKALAIIILRMRKITCFFWC